jgi:Glycosyl hydrolases family 18
MTTSRSTRRRPLPDRLLIGYTTQCSPKVEHAVRNGVNVVIWAFCEMTVKEDWDYTGNRAKCISRFDRDCAKNMIAKLDAEGFDDTIHLVSFGGWNGPHLPHQLSPEEMYQAWKDHFGDIFHGIDWDLEGNDRLDSPTNFFRKSCLDSMGRFSELAKRDGYIVGMAPPQSYLDVSSFNFSFRVDLKSTNQEWHNDFHYYGANVYAYLLAKYERSIDFVSVQFYESYSRAGLEVYHEKLRPEDYLYNYVHHLASEEGGSFLVDFLQEPWAYLPRTRVRFPLKKLVFGFANGWAPAAGAEKIDESNDKVCYFEPTQIENAYKRLEEAHLTPRGFMYWVM